MRKRLTYANVAATLALIFALTTGGAYAINVSEIAGQISGSLIKNNSLTSADVRNQTLGSVDVKPKSLPARVIADQTLTSLQIQPESLLGDLFVPKTLTKRVVQDGSLTGEQIENGSITGNDVIGSTLGDVNAATVDGRSLNCPAGTSFYVWGCWELNTNAPANWTGAAIGCGIKGGILPGVSELAAFADQTAGVVISTPEWTSEMSDGAGANALQGIKFNEPTVVNYSPFTDNNPYRCVLPIIN